MRTYRSLFSTSLLALLLLLLTACSTNRTADAGGNASQTGGQAIDVQVTLSEFHIQSSLTSFEAGKSYRFVVKNTGKTTHELMLMPNAMTGMGGMDMGDMDDKALAHISSIAPGESQTLAYTFPASTKGSKPELACFLPGHYDAGMKLDTTVM